MQEQQDISPLKVDTGLACLVMLARFHQIAADSGQLTHQFKVSGELFSQTDILLAAKQLGMRAKVVKTSFDRLDRTPLPAMAADKGGGYFILARFADDKALIHDPFVQLPKIVEKEKFLAQWNGELILFTSSASMIGEVYSGSQFSDSELRW